VGPFEYVWKTTYPRI